MAPHLDDRSPSDGFVTTTYLPEQRKRETCVISGAGRRRHGTPYGVPCDEQPTSASASMGNVMTPEHLDHVNHVDHVDTDELSPDPDDVPVGWDEDDYDWEVR